MVLFWQIGQNAYGEMFIKIFYIKGQIYFITKRMIEPYGFFPRSMPHLLPFHPKTEPVFQWLISPSFKVLLGWKFHAQCQRKDFTFFSPPCMTDACLSFIRSLVPLFPFLFDDKEARVENALWFYAVLTISGI